MNYRLKWLTETVEKYLNKFAPKLWNYSPAVISFFLGMTTAFFYRDELNFPTYLRIKKAYLMN